MIAEGKYTCKIGGAGLGESKNQTPYIYVNILVPPEDTRTVFIYVSEAAYKISSKKLMALGFNGNFEKPEFSVKESEFICKHEEWEGQVREKWEMFWEGGFEHKEVSKSTIDILKARAKRFGMGVSTPTPAPAQAPTLTKEKIREEVWDKFIFIMGENDGNAKQWADFLVKFFPTKKEAALTAADWQKLAGVLQNGAPF